MNTPALLFFLALSLPPYQEPPEPTKWASADGSTIELIHRTGYDATPPNTYLFEIRKEGQEPQRSLFHSRDLRLDRAWINPIGKLIVIGKSGRQASHLLIGDPGRDGNEWIMTWLEAPSPSGKFFALKRFLPRYGHDLPDVVTIYDLRESAAANRPVDQPAEQEFEECAGRVVYPERNAFGRTCQWDPNDPKRDIVSPFLWRQSGELEQLFFLAQEANTVFLIRTSLPAPTEPVVIWRQELDLRGRYHPEPHNDYNFKPALKVYFDKLSWSTTGRILIELDPIYGFGSSFEIAAD